MRSCLFDTNVMHHRLSPKEHKFNYRFFSFYLDLDEINELVRDHFIVSRNRFNLFSFYDKDHLDIGGKDTKENIIRLLLDHGIDIKDGRIMLLSYLRIFGYAFNPVSFYFCFDAQDRPICVLCEIGNTFGELKPFLIKNESLTKKRFQDEQVKHYYISPFMKLDDRLEFKLEIPGEGLNIRINTKRKNGRVLLTSMVGAKKSLNTATMLKYALLIPFETIKVIVLIHWHALILFLKKIPYEQKESNPQLQKGVYREWSNAKNRSKTIAP